MLKQRLTGILQRSVLVFLVVLLTACAAALPVPTDVAIIPPGSDLAPELAAFSGTWEGLWEGQAPGRLIVERIDATSARIVIIWGTGYSRHKANVLPGGKIEFGGSGRPYFVFTMSKDRTSIGGEREHQGRINTTTMKKVGQQ
jgi:hypothetical protein